MEGIKKVKLFAVLKEAATEKIEEDESLFNEGLHQIYDDLNLEGGSMISSIPIEFLVEIEPIGKCNCSKCINSKKPSVVTKKGHHIIDAKWIDRIILTPK